METEIWKKHPEIVGIEVSTLGGVRTMDRMVPSRGNEMRLAKGKVLNQYENAGGYLYVHFRMNGKLVNRYVHRLIAEAFIPNPDNLPQVNHLDCDRKNNKVENLEFCTVSYNAKYREKFGISSAEALGHPVFAMNLASLEVSHFPSQIEASRVLELKQQSINAVIRGKNKQTGGFWFVNDDENADDAIKNKLHKIRKGE